MPQWILLITRLIRNRAVMRSLAQKHRAALCGLELGQPGEERWAVILPDPSNQWGSFKVQHLDRTGLGNHVGGYPTPKAALRAAIAAGYAKEAPGIVKKLAASTQWQALYRTDLTPKQSSEPLALAPLSSHSGESHTMPKSKGTPWTVTLEKRHQMIAEAAYFRAERRGFQGGCPIQDWLEAEREIGQIYFQPVQSLREALVFL